MAIALKSIVAYCVVLFGTASGFCTNPNLVSDGGFELPVTGPGGLNSGFLSYTPGATFAGVWTVVGPGGDVAVVPSTEYTTGSAGNIYFLSQEGSQSLDLTGALDIDAAIGVQQTFTTIAGHSYSLSFYVGAVTTSHWAPYNGSAVINVKLNGSSLLTAINSDASGDMPTWKLFNSTFIAASSSTTLAFLNGSAHPIGFNGLDNITVMEVPEPGSCALLALGAASLWGLNRKRTKHS